MISTTNLDWKAAHAHPVLRPGEVHVWRAQLSERRPEDWGHLLSPAESIRAGRFHFERDRARFICGRSLLRTILGRYLATDPCELRFMEGPHGKPELTGTA